MSKIIKGAYAIAYEVKPGSHMALAGYACGWYWEHMTAKEPHGPFDSFDAAARAALAARSNGLVEKFRERYPKTAAYWRHKKTD